MVGNGDAMGIAADIVQDVCRACQGRLGVDDPFFGIELRTKLLEVLRRAQGWGALNERQAPVEPPWASASQNFPRKTVLKARTGKRKRGSASIQRAPLAESAPAAMMQWTWKCAPKV